MENWRKAWRKLAQKLPTAGLEALRLALLRDDPQLVRGYTVFPLAPNDAEVERACAISYCGWKGGPIKTVAEVQGFFETVIPCSLMHYAAAGGKDHHGWFLSWFDETPRKEMRRDLLPEVNLELARRSGRAIDAEKTQEQSEPMCFCHDASFPRLHQGRTRKKAQPSVRYPMLKRVRRQFLMDMDSCGRWANAVMASEEDR